MLFQIYLFIICLRVSAVADVQQGDPLERFIKLTFGVSKAAYLPLKSGRFLQNGQIIENPSYSANYDNPKDDRATCSIGGWIGKYYEIHETEVMMFKSVHQKLVVFGFRGTDHGEDWGKNLDAKIVTETIGTESFLIHKGFVERYHFISSWFEKEYTQVPKDYRILLTGHSLGGAEATIAAVFAAKKLNRKPDGVYTYGSPKVGPSQFKNYYEENVGCDRTMRIIVKFDSAPSFPFNSKYTRVCPDFEVQGKFSLNPLYYHRLYGGYEDGIKRRYQRDMNGINIGCD